MVVAKTWMQSLQSWLALVGDLSAGSNSDLADLPSLSEQSAAQAAEAQEAQYRLFEADKAHSEAWHAANGSAPPETAADWQARYPLLHMDHRGAPTLYDLGLVADREVARDEQEMEPEAGV